MPERAHIHTKHKDCPNPARAFAQRAGAVAFWIIIWEIASLLVNNALILASPLETLATLGGLIVTWSFWKIVGASFLRIICGFILAFMLAIACSALASHFSLIRIVLAPLFGFIKSTPIVCIVVLLLIWFGAAFVSTIAILFVVTPAIYFATLTGFDELDAKIGEMLDVHHANVRARLCGWILPGILPYIVSTCRLVVGMSWKAGIAAELIGISIGTIGERIYQSKLLLMTGDLFSWTIVIVLLAALCEELFLRLLTACSPWISRHAYRFPQTPHPRAEIITSQKDDIAFENLTVKLGNTTLFEKQTARFEAGSRIALMQASGSGKTTFLHLLADLPIGTDAQVSGHIRTPDHISMVFQECRLIDQLSAFENVALVSARWNTPAQIRSMLSELLEHDEDENPALLDRPCSALSGGQRRRVELVRALACPSSLVCLDEPFASLDQTTRQRAIAFVNARLDNRTLVIASHASEDASNLGAHEYKL